MEGFLPAKLWVKAMRVIVGGVYSAAFKSKWFDKECMRAKMRMF